MTGRLIFISGKNTLFEKAGGHTSYVRAFARAATLAGYHVHLFAVGPREETVESDYGTHHLVPSVPLSNRSVHAPLHGRMLARAIVAFGREHRGPLLLHGMSVWTYAGLLALPRLRRHGVEATLLTSSYTVAHEETRSKLEAMTTSHPLSHRWWMRLEHGLMTRFTRPVEARYHRACRLVLVNYRSVQQLLEQEIGPGLPVRLVPYAAEFADETPPVEEGRDPGRIPQIAMLSRHDPRKGVDILIRALALLQKRGVPFRAVLMGPDTLLEFHRRLAASLGLDPARVAIPGFVEDAQSVLRQSDIFVLPSLREHSGSISLLEAMRLGIASVASACDGIPEDITDGESGLLVEPGNVEALAAAIERLIREPDLRQRLGRSARETFLARFRQDRLVGALRDIYTELGFPPSSCSA